MRVFCDCEFNGGHGELISMALVSEDGEKQFYEVVEFERPEKWVAENVVPILNKKPIPHDIFRSKLKLFLEQFASLEVVVDHPADIYYFTQALVGEMGECLVTYPIVTVIDHNLSAKKAIIRHNALEDAKALRIDWLTKQGFV